ncbi:MAG: hypothetical protein KIS30_02820 [Thermoplasmata archaeon]|nr:hypothetical protein [Candidatus Sysuiplasma acidicola]MBX8645675.1 hypothetical protein [Candidatus Sysuiplasma acidicola]MDH2906167.1 hypothetical protein [Methanomassiliicoccales archaeon]
MQAYSIEMSLTLGEIAEDVQKAVEIDNGDFLSSSASGGTIVARASSASLMSLLRTADDFIAGLEVAVAAMLRKDNP